MLSSVWSSAKRSVNSIYREKTAWKMIQLIINLESKEILLMAMETKIEINKRNQSNLNL